MADEQVSEHIEALVKEEHELLDRGGTEHGLDPDAGRELDGRSMLAPLTAGDWSGWRPSWLSTWPTSRTGAKQKRGSKSTPPLSESSVRPRETAVSAPAA